MILYIIAIILFVPISIINFFVVLFQYGYKWCVLTGYYKSVAIDIDIMSNRAFRALWNATLVQKNKDYYQFGKYGETISSALGKNERLGTLSKTGKFLVSILNLIDKNHCKNSINDNI